jgi:hypothetical protein
LTGFRSGGGSGRSEGSRRADVGSRLGRNDPTPTPIEESELTSDVLTLIELSSFIHGVEL